MSAAPQTDYAECDRQQAALCKAKGWPHFAPRRCYSCRAEIYSDPLTASEAATKLITGCRLCFHSFCD